MLKTLFTLERRKGFSLGFGVECANVEVQHPTRNYTEKQPTLTVVLLFFCWSLYFMVYKPAKIRLNRKERRANKLY